MERTCVIYAGSDLQKLWRTPKSVLRVALSKLQRGVLRRVCALQVITSQMPFQHAKRVILDRIKTQSVRKHATFAGTEPMLTPTTREVQLSQTATQTRGIIVRMGSFPRVLQIRPLPLDQPLIWIVSAIQDSHSTLDRVQNARLASTKIRWETLHV